MIETYGEWRKRQDRYLTIWKIVRIVLVLLTIGFIAFGLRMMAGQPAGGLGLCFAAVFLIVIIRAVNNLWY